MVQLAIEPEPDPEGLTSAVSHSTVRPYGSSSYHTHCTVQFALLGSNDTPGPAGMELGFVMFAHRRAYGLLPGRPEGENVDSFVTCHGSSSLSDRWCSLDELARVKRLVRVRISPEYFILTSNMRLMVCAVWTWRAT